MTLIIIHTIPRAVTHTMTYTMTYITSNTSNTSNKRNPRNPPQVLSEVVDIPKTFNNVYGIGPGTRLDAEISVYMKSQGWPVRVQVMFYYSVERGFNMVD